jgi:MFS family permease
LSSTPTPATPDTEPRLRRLVLLAGAILIVDTMFFAAITPLLPEYSERLSLSKSAAGVLSAAYPIGAVIGSLPASWLAARWGARPTVLLGLGTVAATTVVFGFANDVVLLDTVRFIQGVGGGALWAGAMTWLMAAAPRERRAELIGGALASAIFGTLLGPAIGATAGVAGTGPTFAVVALAAAGVAVAVLRTPPPPPSEMNDPRRLAAAFRHRLVAGGVWLIVVPSAGFGLLTVLGSLHLDALGASALGIGAVWVVAAAVEGTLSPIAGRLVDRRGIWFLTRYGLAAAAVLTVAGPLPGSAWVLAGLIVALAAAYGTLWVPGMALIADGVEASGLEVAYAFAIFNMFWAGAQIAGSAGGAALAQATSDGVPYTIVAALFAATLLAVSRRTAVPAR